MTDKSQSTARGPLLEDLRRSEARLRTENAVLQLRVTELTRALREEQSSTTAARESAEAAIRSKNDVLAIMSHEIRTPMNGVLGMLEFALDTELTSVQRDYVATAQASALSLLDVIDRIADVQPAVDSPGHGSQVIRSLRVLVAEDNLVNQKVARGFLEKDGQRAV